MEAFLLAGLAMNAVISLFLFAAFGEFVLKVDRAFSTFAAFLADFALRGAVAAEELGYHIHVDHFVDASREAGAAAASAMSNIHQADIYFFHGRPS